MTQPKLPFSRVLVPYDGSEPAQAALRLAITLAKAGASITIASVVDEQALVAQSATSVVAFDPTPIMDALDEQARAILADANFQCKTAHLTATLETVHDSPVEGIVALTQTHTCDLVIMGTHARHGVERTFLGSTTEGVLRTSHVPVLTVRADDPAAPAPFSTAVVAIDDSGPADAAAAVAADLVRTEKTSVIACSAIETSNAYEEARTIVGAALRRAALPADTPVEIRTGAAATAIIAAAQQRNATLIIAGTHGRRGLNRLLLGSVAEQLVRTSTIPVLIVPMRAPE
jgi:nucleotide-binding universal stress UspA family protein